MALGDCCQEKPSQLICPDEATDVVPGHSIVLEHTVERNIPYRALLQFNTYIDLVTALILRLHDIENREQRDHGEPQRLTSKMASWTRPADNDLDKGWSFCCRDDFN